MNETLSSATSYGIGGFMLLMEQDLTQLASIGGLILIAVRIMADVPKAIKAWHALVQHLRGEPDGSED